MTALSLFMNIDLEKLINRISKMILDQNLDNENN